MPVDLTVRVNGVDRAERAINTVGSRATNVRPALQAIAQFLLDVERRQFETAGVYGGRAWSPLKARTVARKRDRGGDTRILRASGALMASLTQHGAAGQVWDVTGTMLRVGSSLPTAEYAEHGARGRQKRKLIVYGKRESSAAAKTIGEYLRTGKLVRPVVR
jgi:hypothetical protein